MTEQPDLVAREGLSWTQPICERDWLARRSVVQSDGSVHVDRPTQLRREFIEVERCSFCGGPTIFGVFVREDPAKVPFPATKDES